MGKCPQQLQAIQGHTDQNMYQTHQINPLRIDQQPICRNSPCGNLNLTIKHCLQDCPQWRDSRKKHNIQSEIWTLPGKDYEVDKIVKFIREIGMFLVLLISSVNQQRIIVIYKMTLGKLTNNLITNFFFLKKGRQKPGLRSYDPFPIP